MRDSDSEQGYYVDITSGVSEVVSNHSACLIRVADVLREVHTEDAVKETTVIHLKSTNVAVCETLCSTELCRMGNTYTLFERRGDESRRR